MIPIKKKDNYKWFPVLLFTISNSIYQVLLCDINNIVHSQGISVHAFDFS